MKCIHCGSNQLKVTDSRNTATDIRRRRECLTCGDRFTTYETARDLEPSDIEDIRTRLKEYNAILDVANEMRIELVQSISKYFIL